MLSDDIFLDIFRYYLAATPRFWPPLTWVCQRWRQIIFTSPLGLNIRLYCTYGRPISKALDHWLTLPIVMEYGGLQDLDPPLPEDDANIMAAFKQSDRVRSIRLTVTRSLLEKLSAISGPFLELEELVLLSHDNMQMTLPGTFRWDSRLRSLQSTRIGFPSFPRLLLPSRDLIDLQLNEVPISGYFSPESFVDALSGMTQLRSLSLHFISLPPRRNYLIPHPQLGAHVVLPALTYLKYQGTSKYLDDFIARIYAPQLGNINITFFFQPTMDSSKLGRFIERTEKLTSLIRRAEIETSAKGISVSFTGTDSGTDTRAALRVQISCKRLDWQLSCMAQVCDQFSPFLFRVEELRAHTTESPREIDDVASEQWLDLVRSFISARQVWMANELAKDILDALGQADGGETTVLPTIRHLSVDDPTEMNDPSWDALLSFINLRALSDHPVKVNAPYNCHICHAPFRRQIGLQLHFKHEHAFQIMCSHCGHVVSMPGNDHLFWSHLAMRHPQVASKDELLSNPLLSYPSALELEGLRRRHSFLLAPDEELQWVGLPTPGVPNVG